ncbi:hypothetical protein DSECCO2_403220 [anaerobic digester metagenome]
MDTSLLDVFHDPADQHVDAVRDGVHVQLDRVLEERVDQHRMGARDPDRLFHVGLELDVVVDDLHRAAAEDVTRTDQDRVPDLVRHLQGILLGVGGGVRRARDLEPVEHRGEPVPVFGHVHCVRARPQDPGREAPRLDRLQDGDREVDRVLSAELDHHALVLVREEDVHHVLELHRLEEEPVRGVKVRGDRLGVVVDDVDLDTLVAEGGDGMDRAVIELDPLPDTDRARAQDQYLAGPGRGQFRRGLGRRVEVRRLCREFGRAGVDHLVGRVAEEGLERGGGHAGQLPELGDGEPVLPCEKKVGLRGAGGVLQPALQFHDVPDLLEEEGGDEGEARDLLDREALPEGVEEAAEPLIGRVREEHPDLVPVGVGRHVRVKGAERLLEGLLDRPADRHHLSGRLHRRRQGPVGPGELVEGPARHLDHDIVDRRLERGGGAAGHRVRDLVEGEADRDLGRDTGDRVAGRLGGEGRGARDSGVDLDDPVIAVLEPELDVAPALDPERADDLDRRAPEGLELVVTEGQDRGDHDRFAGMDTHRIDVLHAADDDAAVVLVAHHLELDLFPPDHGLLDEHLVDAGVLEPELDDPPEFLLRRGDPSAGAAEGVRRPDDRRKPDGFQSRVDLVDRVQDHRPGDRFPDLLHQGLELLPVLAPVDRLEGRAQDLDAIERPHLRQFSGQVQAGLASHAGEDPVGSLLLYDLRDDRGLEGLDVDHVRRVRVGLDRGRVGVDEHDLDALLAQCTACLGAGEVELGCLADLDRARTDQHDLPDIVSPGHQILRIMLSKKCVSVSRGPPCASG